MRPNRAPAATTGAGTPAITLHATTVALLGRAALIIGPSGSGKSALALQMMGLGAELVADDRTQVWRQGDDLWAKAPPGLPALIEARGLGLLPVPHLAAPARVAFCVDMDQVQSDRLPAPRHIVVSDVTLPLVFHVPAAHFPFALVHYLRHGREA